MKRVIQLLGWLWLFAGLTAVLASGVGIFSGANVIGLGDWAKLLGWLVVAIMGGGLFLLREWARRIAIGVVLAYALGIGVWVVAFAGLAIDGTGLVLFGILILIYGLLFALLFRAKQWTTEPSEAWSRRRGVAVGIAGLLAIAFVYVLVFDGEPRDPEAFPVIGQGEFQKLEEQRQWQMARVIPSGAKEGALKTASGRPFTLEVRPGTDSLELVGLPPLAKTTVRLDTRRNLLFVDDWLFDGGPDAGSSAIAGGARYEGWIFGNTSGAITGEVLVFFFEDGRLLVAFRKFQIYGKDIEHIWLSELPAATE